MTDSPDCCLNEETLAIGKELIERRAGNHLLMFIKMLPIDRKNFFQNLSEKLNVTYGTVEMYTKRKLPKKYLKNEFEAFICAILCSIKKYSDTLGEQKRQEFLDIWRVKRKELLTQLEDYRRCYSTYNIALKDVRNKDNLLYQRKIIVGDFLTGHYPECIGKKAMDIEDINEIRLAFYTVFPDWHKKVFVETKRERDYFQPITKAANPNEIDLDFTYNFLGFL